MSQKWINFDRMNMNVCYSNCLQMNDNKKSIVVQMYVFSFIVSYSITFCPVFLFNMATVTLPDLKLILLYVKVYMPIA